MINTVGFGINLIKYMSIVISLMPVHEKNDNSHRILCNGYISYTEKDGELFGSTTNDAVFRYVYVTVDLKAQTMTKPWGGTRDGLSVSGLQGFTILRDSLDVLVLMGRHAEIIRIDRSTQPYKLQAMDTDGAITVGICKPLP